MSSQKKWCWTFLNFLCLLILRRRSYFIKSNPYLLFCGETCISRVRTMCFQILSYNVISTATYCINHFLFYVKKSNKKQLSLTLFTPYIQFLACRQLHKLQPVIIFQLFPAHSWLTSFCLHFVSSEFPPLSMHLFCFFYTLSLLVFCSTKQILRACGMQKEQENKQNSTVFRESKRKRDCNVLLLPK